MEICFVFYEFEGKCGMFVISIEVYCCFEQIFTEVRVTNLSEFLKCLQLLKPATQNTVGIFMSLLNLSSAASLHLSNPSCLTKLK